MKNLIKNVFSIISVLILGFSSLEAKGAGTSGGLTLIETPGARSSALAGSFSSMNNDIEAFGYNPASLGTLQNMHASFLYQSGLADDAFGTLLFGQPLNHGGWGLQVGYYNGGDIELFDGTSENTVNAQTDMLVALGMSRDVGPVSLGFTGKYLSSELIERERANAFAGDFGMSMPVRSNLNVGASIQNIGTQLKFVEEGDDLPRIARAGLSMGFAPGGFNTSLMLEAPYFMNEAEFRPSVGLEVMFGPLSVRGGYKSAGDGDELTVGSGFLLGSTSLNYAFGMVEDLDSSHRVSLGMRFGHEKSMGTPKFVKQEKKHRKKETVATGVVVDELRDEDKGFYREAEERTSQRHTLGATSGGHYTQKAKKKTYRVYRVRPGDTLAKIATRHYGTPNMWDEIYSANKHLIENPRNLEVGQRILLP